MDTRIVLGLPAIGTDPTSPFWAPLACQAEFRRLRDELENDAQFYAEFWQEYLSVLMALADMEIDFVVLGGKALDLMPHFRDMANLIIRQGFELVEVVPELDDIQYTRFPRDMAVKLSNGTCLVDADLTDWNPPPNSHIIKSMFGQGGRVHHRRDVLLAPDIISAPCYAEDYDLPQQLGMRVGQLPHALNLVSEKSLIDGSIMTGTAFDDHVDRSSGLLEDRNGHLHLIVDPLVWSGYQGQYRTPGLTVAKTLRNFRRVCRELDIEMHVPSRLAVPLSVGFIQFEDGRVLMTSGDEEVAQIVTDIVGVANLFLTQVPLLRMPVISRAGLRCLIGEIPEVMIKK
ncbi:MAG: hypothetical protein WC400_03215 [Patescibacteria group bacterium]|jgi:hypothetical protein